MFTLDCSKTSRKRRISFLNMFSFIPLYKHAFKKKLFLTSLVLNNFPLLKRTLIIGLLPIISKIHHFQHQFFNLTLNIQIKKNGIHSLFPGNKLDITVNLFGILKSKTLKLTFLHISLKMNFYIFPLPLKIIVLISITSVISLSHILPTSPMIIKDQKNCSTSSSCKAIRKAY